MKQEELKDEFIEIETVQIALSDKLHRLEEIQNNLQKRVDLLRKRVHEKAI